MKDLKNGEVPDELESYLTEVSEGETGEIGLDILDNEDEEHPEGGDGDATNVDVDASLVTSEKESGMKERKAVPAAQKAPPSYSRDSGTKQHVSGRLDTEF